MKHSTSRKWALTTRPLRQYCSVRDPLLGSIIEVPDVLHVSLQHVAILLTQSHDDLEFSQQLGALVQEQCFPPSLPLGLGRSGWLVRQ